MKNQSFAVTAVGIAHGISTLARRSPRPRKLPFMIIANQKPEHELDRHRHHGEDRP